MAITVDQATLGTGVSASGTSLVLTTTAPVASGSTVVLYWGFNVGTPQTLDSITGGLTWDIHMPSQFQIGNYHIGYAVAHAPSGLAVSTALTLNFSASVNIPVVAGIAFAGVLDTSPIDDDSNNQNTGPPANDNWTTGTITASQAGNLLLGWCLESQGGLVSTPAANYTESHDFQNATSGDTWTAVYRILGAAGDYTPGGQWNNADSNGWGAVGLVLKSSTPFAVPLRSQHLDFDYSR